jgi:hypothetical protein
MIVAILYTNHRGETATRRVTPERIWFGETKWHEGEQWFLDAIDEDRPGRYRRSFAMRGIQKWEPAEDHL